MEEMRQEVFMEILSDTQGRMIGERRTLPIDSDECNKLTERIKLVASEIKLLQTGSEEIKASINDKIERLYAPEFKQWIKNGC